MKRFNFFLILSVFFCTLSAQEPTGDWAGNLVVPGATIPLIFHVEKAGIGYQAKMDSPRQQAFGIPIDSASYNGTRLWMEVSAMGMKYEGNFKKEKDSILGTYTQAGQSFTLNLGRSTTKVEKPKRPQEPQPPFPYKTEDISFPNKTENFNLAGTLSMPSEGEDFPAVILISGSGPENRDEEVFGHKPFLVLADYLTRNGFAVLRYDDRGVGKSGGNYASANLKNFTSDAAAAISYLKSRTEINTQKIGLLGHSEGGLIAPKLAVEKQQQIAFVVMLAGPSINGDELLLLQKKKKEEALGIDMLAIAKAQENFKGAYHLITENPELNAEQLKPKLKNYFSEHLKGANENLVDKLSTQLTSPGFLSLIKSQPAPILKKINCPVLALYGSKDFQVPAQENSAALKEIANKNIEVKQLPGLNHLFQESKTGMDDEYAKIEQSFSPIALKIIGNWIAAHTK